MNESQSSPTNVPKGGLSPDFNLGQRIEDLQVEEGSTDLPKSVEAADDLYKKLNTDSKTGLHNEGGFRDNLARKIDALEEGDEAICYISDLDGFKGFNDLYGHDAGDELLVMVAEVFKATFKRDTDVIARGDRENTNSQNIARLCGDEFATLTITKSRDDIGNVRMLSSEESIKHQSEAVNIILQEKLAKSKYAGAKVSLSVGAAVYKNGDTAESLFARADLKMFEVKYKGKMDRITPEDVERLQDIIPYVESLGARVETWLKRAAFPEAA